MTRTLLRESFLWFKADAKLNVPAAFKFALRIYYVAVGVRFELTVELDSTMVFETISLNHSDTPPFLPRARCPTCSYLMKFMSELEPDYRRIANLGTTKINALVNKKEIGLVNSYRLYLGNQGLTFCKNNLWGISNRLYHHKFQKIQKKQ